MQASRQLHSTYTGATTQWASPRESRQYCSAQAIVFVHDASERPIEGATVTAAWSGAVTKTVTIVTDVNGRAVLKSGTPSYDRQTVMLHVTDVAAPQSFYDAAANHDEAGGPTTMRTWSDRDVTGNGPAQ